MTGFDSHCHFDFPVFDPDRSAVWQQACSAGVTQLIIPGVSPDNWLLAERLSHQLSGSPSSPLLPPPPQPLTLPGFAQRSCAEKGSVYFAVGVHPWWVGEGQLQGLARSNHFILSDIAEYLENPRCVAIGECGLDQEAEAPLDQQLNMLDTHIAIAKNINKPLILHCHKAHNLMIERLKHHRFSAGGVLHAFSGSFELAMTYYRMGFKLGVGGVVTYPRAAKTRKTVAALPLDAIVLETDAPNSPLCGEQGQRNHPANLIRIAEAVAKLRDEDVNMIVQATTANAHAVFRASR